MKEFNVTFSLLALEDIKQATEYYEQVRSGLSKRFNIELLITLNKIRRNAYYASVRYNNVRCAQINKFPYLVHYQVDIKDNVIIIAVYST